MKKIRTLDELQHRICFLTERLERIMADTIANEASKRFVHAYETQTINNLKDQFRVRTAWLVRCCGC
jgi:hypothetical protein